MFAPKESLEVKQDRDALFKALNQITNAEVDFFKRALADKSRTLVDIAKQTGIWGADQSRNPFWDKDDGHEEAAKTQKTVAWTCIVKRLECGIFQSSLKQFTDKNPFPALSAESLEYLKSLDVYVDPKLRQAASQTLAALDELKRDDHNQLINTSVQMGLGIGLTAIGSLLLIASAAAAAVKGTAILTSAFLWPIGVGLGLIIVGSILLYLATQRDNEPVLER